MIVSCEMIRQWCAKFGPEYACRLRRRRKRPADKWHLDEVFLTINGRRQYLWRAVDQDGDVLDILVQCRRDAKAAKRLFRKLLKRQCASPRVLVTEKLRSHQAAHRAVMPSVKHRQSRYLNNPGGELAPADPPTRTRHETIPHPRLSPTVPGGVQRDLPAFPAPPLRLTADDHRTATTDRFATWNDITRSSKAA